MEVRGIRYSTTHASKANPIGTTRPAGIPELDGCVHGGGELCHFDDGVEEQEHYDQCSNDVSRPECAFEIGVV